MNRMKAINYCSCVWCALSLCTLAQNVRASQPLPIPTPKSETTAHWLGVWEVCFALLIVAAILFVIRLIFGRLGIGNTPSVGGTNRKIKIVERKPLGSRQSLLLVQCRDTEVLLHQSKNTLSTLCIVESTPDDSEEAT
ncbi:MAG: flagellar biosynthetic protein FliO [Phycisphaerales bacterium]|jgi:flagellar biogenesis protein FliO|nr:flagellar biosynthetic protein FliO [Phycisphaerales bacterium]